MATKEELRRAVFSTLSSAQLSILENRALSQFPLNANNHGDAVKYMADRLSEVSQNRNVEVILRSIKKDRELLAMKST